MNNNNIKKLRKKVDIIDYELVLLLAKRFKTTKKIILLKEKNGLPAKDKNREENILKKVGKLAEKLKISTEFIGDIFKNILKESKGR